MRSLPLSASFAALLLALASSGAAAQGERYVTDQLKLESRSGPGTSNRIVRMLESGTPLQVFDEQDGWSRVRLPDGTEAWILSRYLMSEAPARGRLQDTLSQLERARDEMGSRNTQINALQAEAEALREDRDSLATKLELVVQELAALKQTAAGAVALQEQNAKLTEQAAAASQKYDLLHGNYLLLRDARGRDWFLAGAGVLLGGFILGIVIPRIRWRRKRSWSEL
jgi:SH3 domain protein